MSKYQARALLFRCVDEGLFATLMLHSVQACSLLYNIVHLRTIPAGRPAAQDNVAELPTRGHRKWLALEIAYKLDQAFKYLGRFERLQDKGMAIWVRTGALPNRQWQQHRRALRELGWHDSQRMTPPSPGWLDRSAIMRAHAAATVYRSALPRPARTELHRRSQT